MRTNYNIGVLERFMTKAQLDEFDATYQKNLKLSKDGWQPTADDIESIKTRTVPELMVIWGKSKEMVLRRLGAYYASIK